MIMKEETTMTQVSVAVIGCGFAARLHGSAFRRVGGLQIRLRGCSDLKETGRRLRESIGMEEANAE